jgi:hypothetical protein
VTNLHRPLLFVALLAVIAGSLYTFAASRRSRPKEMMPESRLVERLRLDGKLSGPGWPHVVCAREVEGHTLSVASTATTTGCSSTCTTGAASGRMERRYRSSSANTNCRCRPNC